MAVEPCCQEAVYLRGDSPVLRESHSEGRHSPASKEAQSEGRHSPAHRGPQSEGTQPCLREPQSEGRHSPASGSPSLRGNTGLPQGAPSLRGDRALSPGSQGLTGRPDCALGDPQSKRGISLGPLEALAHLTTGMSVACLGIPVNRIGKSQRLQHV